MPNKDSPAAADSARECSGNAEAPDRSQRHDPEQRGKSLRLGRKGDDDLGEIRRRPGFEHENYASAGGDGLALGAIKNGREIDFTPRPFQVGDDEGLRPDRVAGLVAGVSA